MPDWWILLNNVFGYRSATSFADTKPKTSAEILKSLCTLLADELTSATQHNPFDNDRSFAIESFPIIASDLPGLSSIFHCKLCIRIDFRFIQIVAQRHMDTWCLVLSTWLHVSMYNASPIFASDILAGSGMFWAFTLMVYYDPRANHFQTPDLSGNVRTGSFWAHGGLAGTVHRSVLNVQLHCEIGKWEVFSLKKREISHSSD